MKDWSGGTRIASNLRAFNRDWSRRVLGQGATVLLITDGLEREDKGEAGVDLEAEMDRLHRSCRRLIWLNPLLRYEGFAAKARGVRLMLPHVDEFRPVHSLEAIGDLVKALGDGVGGRPIPATGSTRREVRRDDGLRSTRRFRSKRSRAQLSRWEIGVDGAHPRLRHRRRDRRRGRS